MGARRARKKSSTAAVDHKRQHWPWSELPPTTPLTGITRYLETRIWDNNRITAPSITKSYLPTTTRCNNANQRPQLLHVITGKSKQSNGGTNRHRQFLGDSAIDVPTVFDSKNASYWCALRVDSAPEITHGPPPPPLISFHPFDRLGPPLMAMTGLVGPDSPSSGLDVNYSVYAMLDRYRSRTKEVSIRHECATIDPFDSRNKPIELTTSIIVIQGKLFAMSLQGTLVVMQVSDLQGTLVVMQVSDYRLKIKGMSAIRAIPSVNCRFFKEYLIEMNGEILLIFLIYQKSLAAVDHVEVFRLDFVKLGWIKVEMLGGKTMFLKEKCIWVDCADFGCRDDCVYFVEESDDFWRVFDLKSGCFSTVLF